MATSRAQGFIWGIIIIVVLIALVVFATGDDDQPQSAVVFSITDAAADIANVSDIELVIDKLEMYSAAEGWVNIDIDNDEFHLLELRDQNRAQILAEAMVDEGTYDQIRLTIDSVTMRMGSTSTTSTAATSTATSTQATLPSRQLVIAARVNAQANATSSVLLDFLADESTRRTTRGQFVFIPVVRLDSRSDVDVAINTQNQAVVVTGGENEASSTFGMDLSGQTRANFRLGNNVRLDISNGLLIDLNATSTATSTGPGTTSTPSTTSTNSSGNLQINVGGGAIDVSGSEILNY